MEFVVTFAQGAGYLVVLAGTLFCLAALVATLRVIARSEDPEERMASAGGLIWYGGGPLGFIAFYTLACLAAKLASQTSWWLLPAGLVACAMPLVISGLRGRKKYENMRIEIRKR